MINPIQTAPIPNIGSDEITDGMTPELHISYQITIAANLMAFGNSTRNFKQFGLNIGEWRVLATLPMTGPMTASQIVNLVGQDKANVSRSIARLSAKRLIVKIPNPRHKRSPLVWLTNDGKKLYERIVPVFTKQVEMFSSVLTKAEKNELCRLLDKLKSNTKAVRLREGL